MITNKSRYARAKRHLRELNVECRLLERSVMMNPRNLPQAERLEQVRKQISSLELEVAEYRELTEGQRQVDLSLIQKIPDLLVMARVRAGLSQEELSGFLGMKRQQISRFEKDRFQSASLKSVRRIAEVLRCLTEARQTIRSPIDCRELGENVAPDAVSGEDTI